MRHNTHGDYDFPEYPGQDIDEWNARRQYMYAWYRYYNFGDPLPADISPDPYPQLPSAADGLDMLPRKGVYGPDYEKKLNDMRKEMEKLSQELKDAE